VKDHQKDEKRKEFFMVPNSLVDSGLWARMKESERKVYIALCRRSHPQSGLAYPSIKGDLRKLTGCKKDTICQATKRLVNYGLIEKKRAPGAFKFRMIYRVIKEPRINRDIIPRKREQCRPRKDKNTGKFMKSPSKRELDIIPSMGGSDIIPSQGEQKKKEKERKILALREKQTSTQRGKKKKSKLKDQILQEFDKGKAAGEKEFREFLEDLKNKQLGGG